VKGFDTSRREDERGAHQGRGAPPAMPAADSFRVVQDPEGVAVHHDETAP
jgi:hypothetical protein